MDAWMLVVLGCVLTAAFGAIGWLITDRLRMVREAGADRARISVLETTVTRNEADIQRMNRTLEAHDQASDLFRQSLQDTMSKLNSRIAWICGRLGADENVMGE